MTAKPAIPLLVLSLGAGVQSTTLALMAEHGDVEKPAFAVFADTGAEPPRVYRHLAWLEDQLSFPVFRTMEKEGLTKNIEAATAGGRFAGAPFFVNSSGYKDASGKWISAAEKKEGMLRRQCTKEFKIEPIIQAIRRNLGAKKGENLAKHGVLVRQFIGISLDEAALRMKPSRNKWIVHEWPLIEKRMTRQGCKDWLEERGYPEPPRSACSYCPYRSNGEWRDMRDNDPEAWEEAIRIDEMIRGGVRGTKMGGLYVHRSLVPLAEADISQDGKDQSSLFGGECEGMCGV